MKVLATGEGVTVVKAHCDTVYSLFFRWSGSRERSAALTRTLLERFVLEPDDDSRSPDERIATLFVEITGAEDAAGVGGQCDDEAPIAEALLAIDEGFRAVLLLRDLLGLEIEPLSRALGITSGATRSRLGRARQEISGEIAKRASAMDVI